MDLKKGYKSMLPIEYSFYFKDTHRIKMKGWKKIFHANDKKKRAGKATCISEKIDFQSK